MHPTRAHTQGDRVFAYLEAAEEWHPAAVRMVHYNGRLSVSYDNLQLTRIDTDASSKPASHVRPDVARAPAARAIERVGVGKPNGEEDEDDSRATFSLLMVRHRLPLLARLLAAPLLRAPLLRAPMLAPCQAEGGERARRGDPMDPRDLWGVTFADCLAEVGEYTALIELVFGHEDHFGVKVGQLVENKMLVHRGAPDSKLRLSELAPLGPCPEGGLAIPRAKVATIIGAMQDVELHELHGVLHMGRTPSPYVHGGQPQQPSGSSKQARKRAREAVAKAEGREARVMHRGAWRRTHDDSDGSFHREGVGVADWLSKYY